MQTRWISIGKGQCIETLVRIQDMDAAWTKAGIQRFASYFANITASGIIDPAGSISAVVICASERKPESSLFVCHTRRNQHAVNAIGGVYDQ